MAPSFHSCCSELPHGILYRGFFPFLSHVSFPCSASWDDCLTAYELFGLCPCLRVGFPLNPMKGTQMKGKDLNKSQKVLGKVCLKRYKSLCCYHQDFGVVVGCFCLPSIVSLYSDHNSISALLKWRLIKHEPVSRGRCHSGLEHIHSLASAIGFGSGQVELLLK